ncbi:MAG: class III extradiol ring-cleavage dioxygenase [Roseibium sp.]
MNELQETVPPLFLAHGSPTLAIDDTPAHRFLKTLSPTLPKPRFILILSAHWETEGLKLSAPGPLRTYHDFRGFPDTLYEISYPANSDETAVDEVAQVLEAAGYDVELNDTHGLDHGAWVPLSLVYPDAEIPIVAISLPHGSTPHSLHKLGQTLGRLAKKGVLIIGSGSTTHNLRKMGPNGSAVPPFVSNFDTWLDDGLKSGSIEYFKDLEKQPDFRLNHPTDEHLLPLFFAFGAADSEAKPELIHRSYEYAALSMSYYRFAP